MAADVIAVVDGDTLRVAANIWLGQRLEVLVRLRGADAPELRARCEDEKALAVLARDALARLAGTAVQLADVEYDKYGGRVVATVLAGDGRDLAALLVAAGLARAYDGGGRGVWCGPAP